METTKVGIREAKIHLSRLIKYVMNGDEVILTDRGRPVGKIVPMETESLPLEARIQKLEDRGVIKPIPKRTRKKTPLPIPIADEIAQRYLKEDRNGRR
ncbi:MAG: type II toxin-antitoxin system prevent-host-death family antitoxin [Deltaproteobacteria bacterium]|nr:type II toxin-antitoxin system prevent-host-death family antitoxin [Deltaproteobacteria bacterium]